jgi:hypothetical protein
MHGSDSVALETSARRDGSDWVLDGAKRWIGNGSIADVVIVWARSDQDGQVKGFLVENDMSGFEAVTLAGKGGARDLADPLARERLVAVGVDVDVATEHPIVLALVAVAVGEPAAAATQAVGRVGDDQVHRSLELSQQLDGVLHAQLDVGQGGAGDDQHQPRRTFGRAVDGPGAARDPAGVASGAQRLQRAADAALPVPVARMPADRVVAAGARDRARCSQSS